MIKKTERISHEVMREVVLFSRVIFERCVVIADFSTRTVQKKKKWKQNPSHAHLGHKYNSDFIQALKSKLEIYILWKVNNKINYTKHKKKQKKNNNKVAWQHNDTVTRGSLSADF